MVVGGQLHLFFCLTVFLANGLRRDTLLLANKLIGSRKAFPFCNLGSDCMDGNFDVRTLAAALSALAGAVDSMLPTLCVFVPTRLD